LPEFVIGQRSGVIAEWVVVIRLNFFRRRVVDLNQTQPTRELKAPVRRTVRAMVAISPERGVPGLACTLGCGSTVITNVRAAEGDHDFAAVLAVITQDTFANPRCSRITAMK
jgi:hypothetical protein